MLKVKDNVDLKELEKFGFDIDDESFIYTLVESGNSRVNNNDGVLIRNKVVTFISDGYGMYDNENKYFAFDTLYDLIKADLVEKVSDGE